VVDDDVTEHWMSPVGVVGATSHTCIIGLVTNEEPMTLRLPPARDRVVGVTVVTMGGDAAVYLNCNELEKDPSGFFTCTLLVMADVERGSVMVMEVDEPNVTLAAGWRIVSR